MSQIDTLFKRFDRATADYLSNIENKNANTFEESALYFNDVTNIKKNFDNFISQISNLVLTINKLKCKEEGYENTIAKLTSLSSKMNGDTIEISDLTRNAIYNASREVFDMYVQDFKKYTDHYNTYLNTINTKFTAYNKYKSELSGKENELNQLRAFNMGKDADRVQDRINTLKDNMSRRLRDIESNLLSLENTIMKLKEILEKGLKQNI